MPATRWTNMQVFRNIVSACTLECDNKERHATGIRAVPYKSAACHHQCASEFYVPSKDLQAQPALRNI